MLLTQTLSLAGKLRVAREAFIPRREHDEDESLESFATRRLVAKRLRTWLSRL